MSVLVLVVVGVCISDTPCSLIWAKFGSASCAMLGQCELLLFVLFLAVVSPQARRTIDLSDAARGFTFFHCSLILSGNEPVDIGGQRLHDVVNSAHSDMLRQLVDAVAGITTMLARLDLDMSAMQEARADIHRLSTEIEDMRAEFQRLSTEITNLQINQAAEQQVSAAAAACDI